MWGKIRPDIVLFGESLPEEQLVGAIEELTKAELVIIIGTSLTVYPAGNLHSKSNGKIVYINDECNNKKKFDLVIQGKAGEVLKKIDEYLNIYQK